MISARPAPDSRTRLPLPVDRISSARSPGARPLLLSGLAVVLLYVVVYPLHGVHWAAGWDAPFYVVWARRAQAFGLSASNTGTRPGTVGLVASLSFDAAKLLFFVFLVLAVLTFLGGLVRGGPVRELW